MKPENLSHIELEEIVTLHQKHFSFPGEIIIALLKERDEIWLYRAKHNHKLIATVGFSYFEIDNVKVTYTGNVVIDLSAANLGIFLHSQLICAIKNIYQFPFKKKFLCGLATTEEAYIWASHFPMYWPKPSVTTPKFYLTLMEAIANKLVSPNNYAMCDNYCLVSKLANLLKHHHIRSIHITSDRSNKSNDFDKLNKDADLGYQILMLGPINSINFFMGGFILLKKRWLSYFKQGMK